MEYTKCILCNIDCSESLFKIHRGEKETFNIVQCKECGLIYLNPRPGQEEIKRYYNQGYYERHCDWLEKKLIDFLSHIRLREIYKHKKRGKVLDIGCGQGDFLKQMEDKDWKTYGLDVSEKACCLTQDKIEGEVHHGQLSEVRFPEKFFDVVLLWHVLEHLHNPNYTLTEIHRILKDDGILVIEVPNINSPVFKLVKEDYFIFDDLPGHLYFFSPPTLQALLSQNNFKIKGKGFVALSLLLSLVTGSVHKLKNKPKIPFWFAVVILLALSPFLFLLTMIFRIISFFTSEGEVLRVYCAKKEAYSNPK